MVDRYASLLENSSFFPINNPSLQHQVQSIKSNEISADMLKKYIREYKVAVTSNEQKQIAEDFQKEMNKLKKGRLSLAQHFKSLQKEPDTPEFLFVKEELLKTVKVEMSLDVEMKEIINKRKEEKELQAKQYPQASTKLKNALSDLEEKRDQILYLEKSVNECVQLLELIGILVLENGKKIDQALVNVQAAKKNIEKGTEKIDLAKMRTRQSMTCSLI